MMFLVLFGVALLVSSIGFKKYVWFISLGYGFSVCAIGITLTAVYFGQLFSPDKLGVLLTLILITVYGARLGGYLLTVQYLHLNVYIAQLISNFTAAVFTYILFKTFAFRK
ncbi:MAG: hypothetical protein II059_01745, partial [Clostridia bacterium]|nr:hypothetical protein [Clostridia bacterium]